MTLPCAGKPHPGLCDRVWDADGLFGEDSPYASPGSEEYFSPELREAMHLVELRTRAQCHRLRGQPGAWGLVHGDLIAKNCLFGDDGASALDFDNCAWGCFLYDLAPATLQFTRLARGRGPGAGALVGLYGAQVAVTGKAVRPGDTCCRPGLVASCRWLVANRHAPVVRDRLETLLAQRSLTLRDYLGNGYVRRRSEML